MLRTSFLNNLKNFFFSAYLQKSVQIEETDSALVSLSANRLSFSEAKERANSLLQDPEFFECTLADVLVSLPSQLPQGVIELFQNYSRIDWEGMGLCFIDVNYLTVSADNPDWIYIGEMMECPLLVRKTNERVFVITDYSSSEQYLSIYHWLVELIINVKNK